MAPTIDELFQENDDNGPREDVLPWKQVGVWPDGAPVALEVMGDPVPWAVMQRNQATGGRFVAPRQAKAAARLMAAWEGLGVGRVPKAFGVVMVCLFVVERPASHYGSGKNAAALKGSAPDYPAGRPDLSNLVKLVEDALTTQAWVDDDQIVRIDARKAYGRQARTAVWLWLAGGEQYVAERRRLGGYAGCTCGHEASDGRGDVLDCVVHGIGPQS